MDYCPRSRTIKETAATTAREIDRGWPGHEKYPYTTLYCTYVNKLVSPSACQYNTILVLRNQLVRLMQPNQVHLQTYSNRRHRELHFVPVIQHPRSGYYCQRRDQDFHLFPSQRLKLITYPESHALVTAFVAHYVLNTASHQFWATHLTNFCNI